MPSSISPANQRRRRQRRQPVARSSSFFGTLKNIVSASLSWLGTSDDADTPAGKRRRPPSPPRITPNGDDDEKSSYQPTKRMRKGSTSPSPRPSLRVPSSTIPAAYLDPPELAFRGRHAAAPRSSSASIPFSSHVGHNPTSRMVSRTMSIDPLPRRSPATVHPLSRDVSMDSSSIVSSGSRDISLPPSSSNTSFRLRTATPQPHPYRDNSEPPSFSSLAANPTFLRAPPMTPSKSPVSPKPFITLGSLVDSARSTRSPIRQRSSLFDSSAEQQNNVSRQTNVVEKALHDLDIYKTPLVPTRLRSSKGPAPASDMFKTRRTSKLLLMNEDRRPSNWGKKEARVANETKPYAGDGGLKKLLARRKLEVEEISEGYKTQKEKEGKASGEHRSAIENDNDMVDGHSEVVTAVEKPVIDRVPSPPFPHLSISSEGKFSSLRVGRNKTNRTHGRSVARVMKKAFSAPSEEDDAMDGGEEISSRRKEPEIIEEVAKDVSAFKAPEGFSFAKESAQILHDLTNAKEPPIMSLPFSLAKAPGALEEQSATGLSNASSPTISTCKSLHGPPLTNGKESRSSVELLAPPTVTPAEIPAGFPPLATTRSRNVPDFFSKPPILSHGPADSKTLPLALPEVQSIPITQSDVLPTLAGTNSTLRVPAKDAANPLWEGDKTSVDSTPLGRFGQGRDNLTVPTVVPSEEIKIPVAPTFSPPIASGSVSGSIRKEQDEAGNMQSSNFCTASTLSGGDIAKPTTIFGPLVTDSTTTTTTPDMSGATEDLQKESVPTSLSFGKSQFSPTNSTMFAAPSSEQVNPSSPSKPGEILQFSFLQGTTPASTTGTEPLKMETSKEAGAVTEAPKSLFGIGGSHSFSGVKTSEQKSANSLTFGRRNTSEAKTSVPFSFDLKPVDSKPTNPLPFTFNATKQPVFKPGNSPFAGNDSKLPDLKAGSTLFSLAAAKPQQPPQSSTTPFTLDAGALKQESSAFAFGAAPSITIGDEKKSGMTGFGSAGMTSTTTPGSINFSFSGGSDTSAATEIKKPFGFGDPVSVTAVGKQGPSTPPKNEEMSMDESPNRDAQVMGKLSERPGLSAGGNGFMFGNPPTAGGSVFGAQTSETTSSSFAFCTNSSTSAFGKRTELGKTFGAFGEPSATGTAAPFPFGQGQGKQTVGGPREGSSFSFGVPTPTSTTSGMFAFGGSTGNAANGYGQGSTPSSPSTFGPGSSSQSQFQFGAPLGGVTSTFSFGSSQPPSPAGKSSNLPGVPGTPGGFGGGSNGTGLGRVTSPFGAPASPATVMSAPLFTIGAAPEPNAPRQIKRLPTRRGAKR